MEGVAAGSTCALPLKSVATAVCENDRLPGRGNRFLYAAQGEVQFAEVAVTGCCALPVHRLHGGFGSSPHRLDGVRQPANGAKSEPSIADHPRWIVQRQGGDRLNPRRLKEVGEQRKV